jgi:hypothetical protein
MPAPKRKRQSTFNGRTRPKFTGIATSKSKKSTPVAQRAAVLKERLRQRGVKTGSSRRTLTAAEKRAAEARRRTRVTTPKRTTRSGSAGVAGLNVASKRLRNSR